MAIKDITGLTSEQIDVYFNYPDRIGPKKKIRFWGVIITIVGLCLFGYNEIFAITGLVLGLLMFFIGSSGIKDINKLCPKDSEIDNAWTKLAESREDEAYRAANYKTKDAIRDSDYIYLYPHEIPPNTSKEPHYTYTSIHSPNDNLIRRNYLDILRLIYGDDQIISFQETLCLADGWDGLDTTKEYYWTDVAGIEMDQKENQFLITAGGKTTAWPLAGTKDGSDRDSLKSYIEKAEQVSNALRSVLRSKKKSK